MPAVNDAKYMGIGMMFHFTLVFTVAATVILLIKFLYEAYKKTRAAQFWWWAGLIIFLTYCFTLVNFASIFTLG